MDWIAEITAHIPNKGEQLVRYYGAYSNVSRGKRSPRSSRFLFYPSPRSYLELSAISGQLAVKS
jgi:hypothetical protein